jgi:hypothetical protein
MIVPEDYLDDDDDTDDDTDYPGYPNSGKDPRWTSAPGIHPPVSTDQDEKDKSENTGPDTDTDTDTDTDPDPSHNCAHCGKESYIQSETRKNTYNYCDRCEDVTRHRKL